MSIDSDFEHEAKMRAIEAEMHAANAAESTELERSRPFMLLRPRVFPDGSQWCALYGENLQDGVAGFGDTPAHAAQDFDIHWLNAKAGPNAN
ncbi:MAG TPA: hypothetical protein VFS68_06875 [Candidatus Udaeobacter sp.]|nr:hypothetical protein [Candidatus Udaeobacter sp.]